MASKATLQRSLRSRWSVKDLPKHFVKDVMELNTSFQLWGFCREVRTVHFGANLVFRVDPYSTSSALRWREFKTLGFREQSSKIVCVHQSSRLPGTFPHSRQGASVVESQRLDEIEMLSRLDAVSPIRPDGVLARQSRSVNSYSILDSRT
jgi:hypothetical protein